MPESLLPRVTITQRSKPRLVLLSIEDYQRLRHRADARSAGTLETMPDSLLAEVETAVAAYASTDESGQP
ncbi:MAG: type II toxin-antitoxin system prevent-host-death family antitoxin [Azospirillaceae bacterium]|nr:type II toxin-antitoxin system prevent-host-death family antitoxin [Azospirillaceae bacterium]